MTDKSLMKAKNCYVPGSPMSLDMEISESSSARVYDDTGVFLIVL